MARTILEETDKYILSHHKHTTSYSGCQCFKDCYCRESFKPEHIEFYKVIRKKKYKSNQYSTLQKAQERIDYLNNID